ncbi:hypothetical protein ERD80_08805, partial [Pantoea sp. R102]
ARAVQQAQQADVRWQQQQPRSPIDGLPISIKDLFDVADEPTCAGSRVLADAPPAAREPAQVGSSATSNRSLMLIGSPSIGLRGCCCCQRTSACCAC